MTDSVKKTDLNYDLILKRVAAYTQGDEDFNIFKRPVCNRIDLIEYEAETIFIDPDDLSAVQPAHSFSCMSCGYLLGKDEPIIGPKANDKYKATRSELLASNWSWLLSQHAT
jgi:hypothetical protein